MMDARASIIALDTRERECKRAFYIPIWALEITDNDFQTAMFLKQVVFWSQRTDNPNGFYKTYDEWLEESRLNRYRVEKAVKIVNNIAGMELITVCNKKVNGTPKLHYRLDWEALYSLICERCSIGFAEGVQIRNDDGEQIRFAEGAQMDLSTSEQIQYKESDRDIQTEIQTEIADSSFSSDLPPAVTKEKEKIQSSPIESLDLDFQLIQSLAKLCKVSVKDTKLPHIIRQIRETDPDVTPADFRYFQAYYDAVRDKPLGADKYAFPFPLYVLNGWVKFKAWWQEHSEDSILGTLPGCGESLSMPRWFWVSVNDLPVGDGVLAQRFGRQVFYAKQPDGKFAEIEPDDWPAWTRADQVEQSA